MGNGCKKVIGTRRNKSSNEKFNNRFDFRSDSNCSWNKGNYYNDIYIRNFNKDETTKKYNNKIVSLNDNSNRKTSNSIVYIDDLYDILENEKKVKLKKVDNSDVEEFLIIEKHIKVKRKKKKKQRKQENTNTKMKEKALKNEKLTSLLFSRNDYDDENKNSTNFDEPFPTDSRDKKKKKSNSKNGEVETWCSSSIDNKYDIFEEDRRYMLKKRQENMRDQKISSKKNQIDNDSDNSKKKNNNTNGNNNSNNNSNNNRNNNSKINGNKFNSSNNNGKNKNSNTRKNNNRNNYGNNGNNDSNDEFNLTYKYKGSSSSDKERIINNPVKKYSDPFEE
ncbi:conserved Plasmodium protein, unknown function [Plasmodium malariae]|uniref:Uncharacterized protein n=1 Tax=Plasmodium malariae TaxID=5858 RepID=A0A1D3JJR7_PLAMA|nr:conserved Plasmodium protein, unknown function [Plasmodium malariae]SBT86753.1 conserved Plasmodium protein, unknown function [Plasmodium malariae]